ncbi:MAG: hypothetical protein PHO08_01695 [Methylococcales bacterium]|nr:hypothetical protein [Methylococcales bacterium]MDD5632185.1 hypothetical protein [Methylococcales bacterium]
MPLRRYFLTAGAAAAFVGGSLFAGCACCACPVPVGSKGRAMVLGGKVPGYFQAFKNNGGRSTNPKPGTNIMSPEPIGQAMRDGSPKGQLYPAGFKKIRG